MNNYDGSRNYQQQQNLLWQSLQAKYDNHNIQLPSFMHSPSYQAVPMKTYASQSLIPRQILNQVSHQLNNSQVTNQNLSQDMSSQYPMQRNKSEPLIQSNRYSLPSTNEQLSHALDRKKSFALNINAPSYTPITSNLNEGEEQALVPCTPISRTSPPIIKPSQTFYEGQARKTIKSPTAEQTATLEFLKMELSFKDQVNKSMSEKFKLLKIDPPANTTGSPGGTQISMPNSYYQLFKDLTRTLNERTQELEDTKSRLEAIVVGLVMTKDCSITTNGSSDAQELAHRVTNKLTVLQSENEALLRMLSYSNKQSLLIELGLMKAENKALRQKLKELGTDV